jgi:hypothetical protein
MTYHALLLRNCGNHIGVGMPCNQRTPRENVVNVAVAIDIEDQGALATRDKSGCSADRAKGAHRAVDAAGKERLRFGK